MKDVIVILGPTASGKSGAALALSKHIKCELISADSMQIYKKMDIGTAKPSKAELNQVKHHMIDIVEPDETYTVADFQKGAFEIIDSLHNNNMSPIVVGGTGLYINAIVYNLDFTRTPQNTEFRNKMIKEIKKKGLQHLYDRLIKQEPESAMRIHANDEKRIIRRLEIIKNRDHKDYDFLKLREGYHFKIFGLNYDRCELYENINMRVDHMINRGLIDEVEKLYNTYGQAPVSFKAIGYKEIIDYLKGNIEKDEAIRLVKRNSRRFAKRQLTWFKRDERIVWLDPREKNYLNKMLSSIK